MADNEVTIVWGGLGRLSEENRAVKGFRVHANIDQVAVGCSWGVSQIIRGNSAGDTASQVIDLSFTVKQASPSRANLKAQHQHDETILSLTDDRVSQSANIGAFGSQEAFQFLLSCLRATESSGNRLARLVIPLQEGTIVRSDIIPLRLKDAFAVDQVASFAAPLQFFTGHPVHVHTASLPDLLRASAGGILLQQQQHHHHSGIRGGELIIKNKPRVPQAFKADFENKMLTPWIIKSPPRPAARKRLVVVGCSAREPSAGGWMAYVFSAAQALGIDLVIVERPGGWFEHPEFSHLYESLLPADGSWWSNPPGDDVAGHIVDLVRAYGKRVDGIVAFLEPFLATVSRVASQLGLPCQPAASYETATDKYALGVFEGRAAFCGATAEEAQRYASQESLAFPLILKPRLGLNSEGVVRVDDAAGIRPAVDMIQKTFFKSFTMERYCGGPEVDVNVVLLDGEILFCEIADDFPKPGDCGERGASTAQGNFLETYIVYPSALPPAELEMLRDSISGTIKRLGFSSGIMHVEARVDRSSVEYRSCRGMIELAPHGREVAAEPPTPWVLEINPRPPGLTASRIIESVYGIDYFGVALALAVDDKDRVKALSRPFLNGAQYTGVMALIRAEFNETCEGIFDSDDICEELLTRRPDLAQHSDQPL
ncbi:glutathione synthetase ATP-binding domain-like protein [Hypoxylon sp. FL1150]|nr:glutathione synthetase ATP-binding domain-like protein [Hypoxylon sp. FL1150]